MMNVSATKKVISAMLLGSLLVTGAVVYADTLSDTDSTKGRNTPPGIEQREARGSEMLSTLVTEGVITAEEKTTLEKAMETQRASMKDQKDAVKDAVKDGTKPASHFARMAEEGLISTELAAKIDAYMDAQRTAAFAKEVKPLVDAGTFADTAEVKAAMDAVREAMKEKMDALKPADREKLDFKSLTEAERTALKEKMDAERTAMQEKHKAALAEVYSGLVDAGTLTQAQADALQDLMKNHEFGGRGHGPGFGGMDRPAAADKTADTAQ